MLLILIFRASSPGMLETFYQNIQSSESWALGLQILIRVSLLSGNILQNFKSLETGGVQQNFWPSGFSGTWFFRTDVNSCRLLSCRVLSCHELPCRDLQNFEPLETGDVHSELLVFRLLWRSVLQSLQVLNAGDVHQNFCLQSSSSTRSKARSSEAGTRSSELPVQSLQMLLWQIFRTC